MMDEDFSAASLEGDSQVASSSVVTGVKKQRKEVARGHTQAVSLLRLVTFLVLVLTAVGVTIATYRFTKETEKNDFEVQFTNYAIKVVDTFRQNAERRIKDLEALAQQFTTYAVHTNQTFPFVSLPDFEMTASYTLDIAQVVAIIILPLVAEKDRFTWHEYSVKNQGWLAEGLALQQSVADSDDKEGVDLLNSFANSGDLDRNASQSLEIPPVIFKQDPTGTKALFDQGPGPFFPIWQMAPAIPIAALVNLNARSVTSRTRELNAMLESPKIMVSAAADFTNASFYGRKAVMNLFLNRWALQGNDYEDGPVSDLYIPIFDKHYGPNRTLVSVLTAYLYWQGYFLNILPPSALGIIAVLENTCGQKFTYEINGEEATYIGAGDLHNEKYDYLGDETGFQVIVGDKIRMDSQVDGQCSYNIRVYPSEKTEDQYTSNDPVIFSVVVLSIFLFTSSVFVVYDLLVQRRHKVVNTKAVESTAVVSSLFPATVLDRVSTMFTIEEGESERQKEAFRRPQRPADSRTSSTQESILEDMEEPKYDNLSLPIADLYPHCTVLFADIAGFTGWSSHRSPTEVFLLLETVYGVLDKLARKCGVFKIETIGDCYLAVTGLPSPQEDHAARMASFAGKCMVKMNQVVHGLVDRMGPETAKLSMRIGIHSGAVTAGVLRGEKARFQLFGDTVNTASRMESTGQQGRIQASEVTANLLRMAGKNDWLSPRENTVTAKGKGEMRTFWVEPPNVRTASVKSSLSMVLPPNAPKQHRPAEANCLYEERFNNLFRGGDDSEANTDSRLGEVDDSEANTDSHGGDSALATGAAETTIEE